MALEICNYNCQVVGAATSLGSVVDYLQTFLCRAGIRAGIVCFESKQMLPLHDYLHPSEE